MYSCMVSLRLLVGKYFDDAYRLRDMVYLMCRGILLNQSMSHICMEVIDTSITFAACHSRPDGRKYLLVRPTKDFRDIGPAMAGSAGLAQKGDKSRQFTFSNVRVSV